MIRNKKEPRAKEIIQEVKSAVRNWRKVSTRYGISATEQELKSSAFSKLETF